MQSTYTSKKAYPYTLNKVYPIIQKKKDNNINNKIDRLFNYIINNTEEIFEEFESDIEFKEFYEILKRLEFNYTEDNVIILKGNNLEKLKIIIYCIKEIFKSNKKELLKRATREKLIDVYDNCKEFESNYKNTEKQICSNIDKNIGQTLNISGNKGDIFTLATWVNSRAVPNNSEREIKISLTIHFIRNDGTSQEIDRNVNVDGSGWQFKSEVVIAYSDYTNAIVYLVCSYNENETYFDNIGLFKEEFGTSYIYDENGNIISTEDNAKQQEFKYNTNNKLIEMIDPNGQNFIYEYDDSNPENLVSATNSLKNKYSFDYDNYGNIVSTKLEENDGNAVKLEYESHIAFKGWLGVVNDGNITGSLDFTNQMEAISINIISDISNAHVEYQTHVATIGWQNYVQSGSIAGTTGQSLAIEAIKIKLVNLPDYSIKYRTYVEGIGWQDWVKDDEISGTTGQSKKIFAIQIRLEYVKQNKKYIGAQAEYSSNGKYQTKLIDQLGNSVNYTYNNNTGTVLNEINENNTKLQYTYDNLDRITKVDLKDSNGEVVSSNEYTYENDKLKTIKAGDTTYQFIYDEFGNTKQVKIGNQILVSNDYGNNNGNLTKENFGNNHYINYNYDRFNRLTAKQGANGSYTYTYNADSNVKTIVDTINNNQKHLLMT